MGNTYGSRSLSMENVCQLFNCLEDATIQEQCYHFLNNSSDELTNTIYNHQHKKDFQEKLDLPESPGKIKKIKFSKASTFHNYEAFIRQQNCNSDDDLDNILSALSNHIEELQRYFQTIPVICDANNLFLKKLDLIQCELVKLKRFLTFKSSTNQSRSSTITNSDSFQVYNLNIVRILSNRFLILQLLHFECIILHYLMNIRPLLSSQSNLVQELIITQLQSLFRSYYTLLIKLSFELPFAQLIRKLHPKSTTITTNVIFLFMKILNDKLQNVNNESYSQELYDSIINNRCIVIIVDYIIALNKIELICLKDIGTWKLPLTKPFDFDALENVVHETLFLSDNFLSPQMNLVNFGQLVLKHYCSMPKFVEKSSLRSRTILLLSSVCQKLKNTWDQFAYSTKLVSIIVDLLKHYKDYHVRICEESLLNLEKEDIRLLKNGQKLSEKDIRLKSYQTILRDVYELMSLLFIFTESSTTNQYLRHLEIHKSFFENFMQPYIYSLVGTEKSDPLSSRKAFIGQKIDNINEAYATLNLYRGNFDRIIKYNNRLITMCSMFIQRLLPPLILPLEDNHNPFRFHLSSIYPSTEISQHQQNENDNDLDDEDVFNFLTSDEEFNDSDILNESELDESSENYNENRNKSQIVDPSLVQSYLCFFPEISLLDNSNNKDTRSNKLSCSCNEFVSIIQFNETTNVENKTVQKQTNVSKFNWKDVFIKEYEKTKTVIPRGFVMPKPELNFVQQQKPIKQEPMTYPFLDNAIRFKNYYHVKLLDHVKERLWWNEYKNDYDENSNLILIYDVVDNEKVGQHNKQCLKFESRFECANLRRAYLKHSSDNEKTDEEEEYVLLLNSDVNSSSHTQWFYFQVTQMRANQRYRFKIVNCEKKSILYNNGQQPLFYSLKDFEKSSKTWQRINNIEASSIKNIVAYYRNHYIKSDFNDKIISDSTFKFKPYYTLEFTFTFPYDQDECYFAFNTPFSYSFLRTCISYWSNVVQQSKNKENSVYFASQTLCSSLNGNDLPLLTITSKRSNNKHYIMLTGRVHPAESNSSWFLKGFIDYLLLPNQTDPVEEQSRQKLLDNYIFKIIPMLNPDGVINGCTRTDLQAEDLNRHWSDPSLILYPTIYHSKMFLQCLSSYSDGANPVAFLDIHGHSRCHNIFSYSCFPMLSWKKSDQQYFHKQSIQNHRCMCNVKNTAMCKLKHQMDMLKYSEDDENVYSLVPPFATLPLIMEFQGPSTFDIANCSFAMQREREQTARIVAWRQFEIPLSYTIECSAGGCDKGPYTGHSLSYHQLEEMGQYLANAFNLIGFLYCSKKHVPVMIYPKEMMSIDNNKTVVQNLLNRCVRSKTSEKSKQTPKQKKIRQMILKLYPDLKEFLNYHFQEGEESEKP